MFEVNLRMDYKYYERKINDIITKCPIEAGVEILVYNVLDEIVESKNLSLVDINSIWKDKDSRLTTKGGIPDIAVLSPNFEFGNPKTQNEVFGLIEVKATNCALRQTDQVSKQREKTNHHIYTNGLVWVIYDKNGNKQQKIYLTGSNDECIQIASKISISKEKFSILLTQLGNIKWES